MEERKKHGSCIRNMRVSSKQYQLGGRMRGFRVWSDYWKRYSFDAELYPDGSADAVFEDDGGVPHHENTDLVLEFDTGLKDKNGKKIYEGDIVKCGPYCNRPIVFEEGRYWLGEEPDDLFVATVRWEIEVIGNVHENPELCGDADA